MASIIGGVIHMEYSVVDGAVRFLKLNNEVLVDGSWPSSDGWKEMLWAWADEQNLLAGNEVIGWRAWAIRLASDLGRELPRVPVVAA